MTPTEIAKTVLESRGGAIHVNDIALMAAEMGLCNDSDLDDLPMKLSGSLSQNVRTKKPIFVKVKNGLGGYKRGIYRLKQKRSPKAGRSPNENLVTELIESTSTQFTGKGGEYAVMSELLFRGFNSSVMTVDDGIDLIAEKDNSYFHIQVKTTSGREKGPFSFKVRKASYLNHESHRTFYIFVVRRLVSQRNICDFIVIPFAVFKSFVLRGSIEDRDNFSVRISIDDTGHFILNKTEDVSAHVNHFALIA